MAVRSSAERTAQVLRGLDEVVGPMVRQELIRAASKHRGHAFIDEDTSDFKRLAHLVEEVGEVARHLSEVANDGRPIYGVEMRHELVQLAHLAIAWAACLTVDGLNTYNSASYRSNGR